MRFNKFVLLRPNDFKEKYRQVRKNEDLDILHVILSGLHHR